MQEQGIELGFKGTALIVSTLIACLAQIELFVYLVVGLVIIDNIVAIWRAWKYQTVRKWFEYRKLKTTIEKMVGYIVYLLAAGMLDQMLTAGMPESMIVEVDAIQKIVASYIALYEFFSISVHLGYITNLKVFSDIIELIKAKIKIKNILKKDELD